MVYKVSKGGVRSGNTLRGLHTLKTGRYGRQACLIGRSSLNGRGVNKLVETCTDDSSVKDILSSTDVILSLNKRQRWLVPAKLRQMISTGSFNSSAMVSLLEKHKLKRRANCVNFLCNKGRLRSVQPTQKRYFSFNLENMDENVSNRQKRKDRKMAIKSLKTVKTNKSSIRAIHTFTQSGPKSEPKRLPGASLDASKPEYRLEVFYPCPKSCSLTFNPKYTDVTIEVNEKGEEEIKSIANNQKCKRSHRRVKTTRNGWIELNDDVIDHDVDDMWNEAYWDTRDDSEQQQQEEEQKGSGGKSDDEDFGDFDTRTSENLFARLINEAEKVKGLCSKMTKLSRKRSSKRRVSSSSTEEENEKSHIVYTSREEKQMEDNETINKEKTLVTSSEMVTPNTNQSESGELKYFRVIMSSQECSPPELMTKYGKAYAEADCEPRRFIVNITDDVRNVLSTTKTITDDPSYTSFLVFIHDGVYDEGLDVFRVCLNSYITENNEAAEKICDSVPFTINTMDDILNHLIGVMAELKSEGIIKVSPVCKIGQLPDNFLDNRIRVSYEVFRTEQEINRISLHETENFATRISKIVEEMDDAIFCDICYENVNTSQTDSSPGTCLRKCGHVFCDNCWRTHVDTRLRNGAVKIICPGYDCDEIVGATTMLTIVHASKIGQLLQRHKEAEVETSFTSKWCPDPTCGRVIKLQCPDGVQPMTCDVTCQCGHRVCFACLGNAHWPASCDQAGNYTDKLGDLQLPREVADETTETILPPPKVEKPKVMMVEGRLCPRCKRFINKNGGCPMMVCKCGHTFCWKCMTAAREGLHNTNTCIPKTDKIASLSRNMFVHHIDVPVSKDDEDEEEEEEEKKQQEKKKAPSSRQKASMYQKALQQRFEEKAANLKWQGKQALIKKIAAACRKDPAFKREVLFHCGLLDVPEKDSDLATISVTHRVNKFLLSCQDMRSALHHVAEFTFVLLQDMAASTEKSRAQRLANDLSAYCSYFRSIFSAGDHQDARTAVRRLVNIQQWAGRAIDCLLTIVNKIRS